VFRYLEEPVEDKPETEEEKAERRKKEKAEVMYLNASRFIG
jgi:hypothetical protein